MVTSVTLGLVMVFALEGSGFEKASKKTVDPALSPALPGILLIKHGRRDGDESPR